MSMDQIESSMPGFFDIHYGKSTKAKHHETFIYVDHGNRFTHVTLHYSTGGKGAVEGKLIFEWVIRMYRYLWGLSNTFLVGGFEEQHFCFLLSSFVFFSILDRNPNPKNMS